MPAGRAAREIDRGSRTVALSSGDRVLFPVDGITKADLWDYYTAVAPAVLPHLRDRPFTMKRYRTGVGGEHFFQKDAPAGMPSWIPTRTFTTHRRDGAERDVRFPIVNDEPALLWMVQMHCIDLNVWSSRVDRPDRPDSLWFDLDPPDGDFPAAARAAHLVRELLDELGLASLAKTSGSDGVHVVVPLGRRADFAAVRTFAEDAAALLERRHPGQVTTVWRKADRRGVLVDVAQNGRGRTMATVYSVRPRDGAPVSTPLRWHELTPNLEPRSLGMAAALARVERDGDLFAGALGGRQSLGAARRALDALLRRPAT